MKKQKKKKQHLWLNHETGIWWLETESGFVKTTKRTAAKLLGKERQQCLQGLVG